MRTAVRTAAVYLISRRGCPRTGVLASGDAVITDHIVVEEHGVPQLLADPYHALATVSLTAVRLLSDTDFDVLAPATARSCACLPAGA